MIERALRIAATHHRPQSRKGSDIPYITHPFGVAMLLMRFGFDDDEIIAAALLHDAVEDTECTLDELAAACPPGVVEFVAALTEKKYDDQNVMRPWKDRKLEHLEQVESAPLAARAIVLADKLHNLSTMLFDMEAGEDMWSRFRAGREEVEWYHRTMISTAWQSDEPLRPLAEACVEMLDKVLAATETSTQD